MPITTPAQLETYLEKQGYEAQVSNDSVFVPIGSTSAPYTAAFTFSKNGQLQITCQLALLGEFPEDQLGQLALAALDANMQMSPYAFAVIGATTGPDVQIEKCPVVLIDTLPTADLSEEEVGFTLDRLLQAITYSRGVLKLGLEAK